MRTGTRSIIVAVAMAVVAPAAAESMPPDPARILTCEAYARGGARAPIVLEHADGEGRLLLVGVSHTLDSKSDTVGGIWRAWEEFKPTLAFYEGWGWPMGSSPEIVSQYGEPAVVRFLAYAAVGSAHVHMLEPALTDALGPPLRRQALPSGEVRRLLNQPRR